MICQRLWLPNVVSLRNRIYQEICQTNINRMWNAINLTEQQIF